MTKNKSNVALQVGAIMAHYSERQNLDWFDVTKNAIDLMLEQMSQTLEGGGHVQLRGFGSFSVKKYGDALRCCRNPKTGETKRLPRKPKPMFKAGKILRRCVNNRGAS